jgi:hypothetical protein
MISKSTFSEISLEHSNGNYFLRPDRILGCFHIDSTVPPTESMVVSVQSVAELIVEKNRERQVYDVLHMADVTQKDAMARIDSAVASIWRSDFETTMGMDEAQSMNEKIERKKKDSNSSYPAKVLKSLSKQLGGSSTSRTKNNDSDNIIKPSSFTDVEMSTLSVSVPPEEEQAQQFHSLGEGSNPGAHEVRTSPLISQGCGGDQHQEDYTSEADPTTFI